MTKGEFNKTINACRMKKQGKRVISLEKIVALPREVKARLAAHIVRNRGPLLKELASCVERPWLASMGYLHTTKSETTGFTFVHLASTTIL